MQNQVPYGSANAAQQAMMGGFMGIHTALAAGAPLKQVNKLMPRGYEVKKK